MSAIESIARLGGVAMTPGSTRHPQPESCPTCGGPLITVLARRWCVQPYSKNGCGGFWVLRRGRWVRR